MTGPDAAARIDARLAELDDWRGKMLGRVRGLIHAALPYVVETWKWRGVPVWEQDGIPCPAKLSRQGQADIRQGRASPPDPKGLFNASLGGNTRRAIDLGGGDRLDGRAFKALVRVAARANRDKPSRRKPAGK
ncbi:DUF1801 domain-containing protein [Paracoccus sphaerophysae]|uniref:DUF1801 domain-containing protein n=1 Tax=Paracoccus sphaerophysae TaxID=690417 RepID=UPI002352A6B1|nr:DUF1801 domain-containing protein [Paracoccus sphaerophysae]